MLQLPGDWIRRDFKHKNGTKNENNDSAFEVSFVNVRFNSFQRFAVSRRREEDAMVTFCVHISIKIQEDVIYSDIPVATEIEIIFKPNRTVKMYAAIFTVSFVLLYLESPLSWFKRLPLFTVKVKEKKFDTRVIYSLQLLTASIYKYSYSSYIMKVSHKQLVSK